MSTGSSSARSSLPLDPATGAFPDDEADVVLAVSASGDPTGAWNVYDLDTTDGDGIARGPSELPVLRRPAADRRRSLRLLHLDERVLARAVRRRSSTAPRSTPSTRPQLAAGAGGALTGVHIDGHPAGRGPGLHDPAGDDAGGRHLRRCARAGRSTSCRRSTSTPTLDNRIAVWALTGTSTLGTTNQVTLTSKVLDSRGRTASRRTPSRRTARRHCRTLEARRPRGRQERRAPRAPRRQRRPDAGGQVRRRASSGAT